MTSAVAALTAVTDDLKSRFVAREEEINLLATCLVAEANMLLIGLPGTAKSALFGDFFARLEGKRGYFQLTKGSTPEMLLGPISLKGIRDEDKLVYNIEGMLPDVHYATIDEVFKGNSLTRNAALSVINERQLMMAGQLIPCPLVMVGATSNEYPEFNEDGAFYDRFQVRCKVTYIADALQRMRMVRLAQGRGRGLATANEQVTIAQIETLVAARTQVGIPDTLDALAAQLYTNLIDAGIQVGDRRFAESFRLAQANAVLHGRTELVPDDLLVFMHTAWSDDDERQPAQQAVLRTINPAIADITQWFDELEDGFNGFSQAMTAAGRDHSKKLDAYRHFCQVADHNLKQMEDSVIALVTEGRDATRAKELLGRAKGRLAEGSRAVYADPTQDQVA